jgi:hypothetical protein
MKQLELKENAIICSKKIIDAKPEFEYFDLPFKHLVLDNFFKSLIVDDCFKNFPSLDSEIWDKTNDPEIEVKMEMPVKKTFSELFARFISIYFGCSNKRADVIIPSNKPVEIVKPASTTEKVVESDKDAAAI